MFDFNDVFDAGEWNGSCSLTPALVVWIWSSHVDQAPWSAMPLDDRAGYLRAVVDELLDLSGGFESTARRQRLAEVARRHGAFRRGQACQEIVVSEDFYSLRAAVREALAMTGAPPYAVRQAMRCLLPDWRMTRRAALLGFAGV
jgi:hypothetical protein